MCERTAGFWTMALGLALSTLTLGGCDWDASGPGFRDQIPTLELTVTLSSAATYPNSSAQLEVRVRRRSGFEGPVTVSVEGAPHWVSVEGTTIPADQDSATLTVRIARDAGLGLESTMIIRAEGPGGVSDANTVELRVARRGRTSAYLAAGSEHTCFLLRLGGDGFSLPSPTYCWGDNSAGQLGNGTTNDAAEPLEVPGGRDRFHDLAAGGLHSCALSDEDRAVCWGANGAGQIGDGSRVDRLEPTPVQGGHAFLSLTAGGAPDGGGGHTCGLLESGDVLCWGSNASGQLGTGDGVDSEIPVPVTGGHRFHQLVAGAAHTCGLAGDGQAWCWGDNGVGQLGNEGGSALAPVAVAGELEFIDLAAGDEHTCGLLSDGRAYCWGEGRHGERGDGSTASWSSVPVMVADVWRYRDIEAGGSHTCGFSNGGVALCWGANDRGQLGDGTFGDRSSPVPVLDNGAGSVGWRAFGLGHEHTCADMSAGFFCWGDNVQGQLGVGWGLSHSGFPVQVDFQW